ncbi:agmatine/peptidylarginine deiminase [Ulvibacter sp. MAR_2010_11]|uniref:agmatine deiminase family protein n=1 Tax=Ulvibacter sp. MAR_2010_11 TaxID=1250229 RepID=UPI000C2C6B4A|nr:agmatine deiminase family protein [Ulvibacter sp. MAR_2010_11]PKA82003.1 agmatine/peptidylarginine deiminase [Ulvibacter sp. MAR_2010_11]
MKRSGIFLVLIILLGSCKKESFNRQYQSNNYYQIAKNRQVAEWEPAQGVYFVWPPVIPKELIIELSNDTRIFPIVDGQAGQAHAEKWLVKWGINLQNVNFLHLKTEEELQPRDWGPSAVFTGTGAFKITDGQYKYACPGTDLKCNDSLEFQKKDNGQIYRSTIVDTAIVYLGNKLGFDVLELPFTNTGGNVITDGMGTAFSTCVLLTENRFNGISDKEFFQLNDSLLGLSNYNIISNFDKIGIQHIDCLLKLIDEETILVAEPPKNHELYSIYENIVQNELSHLKTIYNRPYTIKRIKVAPYYTDDEAAYLTAYTNSLILNKNVYVPLFGIEEDSLALETWRSVMPGYSIKGYEYVLKDQPVKTKYHFEGFEELGVETGWLYEDAIHCRIKSIWDENMVFISVKKVLPEVNINQSAVLNATIIDYNNANLTVEEVFLKWRVKGEESWVKQKMTMDTNPNHWFAEFPAKEKEIEIEYYIEAQSGSGATQNRPITAPEGFYTFKYVTHKSI